MSNDGANRLEPHFWASGLETSRRFYEEALGFSVLASFPTPGPCTWYQMGRGTIQVMIACEPREETATGPQAYLTEIRDRMRGGGGGALSLYLWIDDADAEHARCVDAGADVVEPLWNPFWGGRQFTVRDPDGNFWTLSGPVPAGG